MNNLIIIADKIKKREEMAALLSILILVLVISILSTINVDAAYISNNLKNRYVLDIENQNTYEALTLLDMKVEEKFANSNLYLNPHFTYNYQDQKLDLDLNEAYLDLYYNDFNLRVGKQKVTWGKADGLVITNLVDPRDYTRYPVLEYGEQFQGVNAIKANYYLGSNSLELIWKPEFKSAVLDKKMLTDKLNGFSIENSQKNIKTELKNSELLIRYSSLGYDSDYEIMMAYIWDEKPTFHIDPVNKVISPEHHRLTVVGGSFSTMRDDYVLRGEAAYTVGKYYNTNDFTKYHDGVVKKDQLKLMAGIDYNYQDYQFSYQILQVGILNYEDSLEQKQFTYQMIFLIKKMFLRDILDTELSFYYDTAQEQLMAKPRVVYDYSDKINFKIGANYLLKGEQRDNVLYFETEYLF